MVYYQRILVFTAFLHVPQMEKKYKLREISCNITRGDEDIDGGGGGLRQFLHTRSGALKKLLG